MPEDKILHLIAGFIIFWIGLLFLKPHEAFGLAVSIGIAKEAWDIMDVGENDVELLDVLFTMIGAGISWLGWYTHGLF